MLVKNMNLPSFKLQFIESESLFTILILFETLYEFVLIDQIFLSYIIIYYYIGFCKFASMCKKIMLKIRDYIYSNSNPNLACI